MKKVITLNKFSDVSWSKLSTIAHCDYTYGDVLWCHQTPGYE